MGWRISTPDDARKPARKAVLSHLLGFNVRRAYSEWYQPSRRDVGMELKKIAEELVAGCREGRATENLDKLYAEDAVSVEAVDQGNGRETRGLDGIKGKHAWWENAMEVIEAKVSDPMLHGDDRFAVTFEMQGREKESGKVFDMKEVAIYHVANGKIAREEFFYG
jgi:ketosteroid isomerase-like protein|tara:strand:- start:723 stop:1217 length:495 start_codon:yes stop_codon:yes gene_type:complete